MVTLVQLWIPILVSAVGVFVASSFVHMVFKWHRSDYLKLPNEDEVRGTVRKANLTPGLYNLIHCPDMKDMQSPEVQQKFKEGPVGMLVLFPSGMPNMGAMLGKWFVLNLFVSLMAAYLAGRALVPGADFGEVARVTATVAFLSYAVGSISDGIWFGRTRSAVLKDLLDAAIYAVVTGAAFALLWPGA